MTAVSTVTAPLSQGSLDSLPDREPAVEKEVQGCSVLTSVPFRELRWVRWARLTIEAHPTVLLPSDYTDRAFWMMPSSRPDTESEDSTAAMTPPNAAAARTITAYSAVDAPRSG